MVQPSSALPMRGYSTIIQRRHQHHTIAVAFLHRRIAPVGGRRCVFASCELGQNKIPLLPGTVL